jgi:transposase-like protein
MTGEQKRKHLADDGVHCPHCGSDWIDSVEHEFNGERIHHRVECCSCGKQWVDVYTLTDVEDDTVVVQEA